MKKLRLAIIFGGISPEHEVSVITALQAIKAAEHNYDVIPLYVTKNGEILTGDHLKKIESYHNLPLLVKMSEVISLPLQRSEKLAITSTSKSFISKKTTRPFDILFPCFHGGVGEGGWIQGLAEYYQIPLVGTGLTGAAIGMDKVAMKHVFASCGITQAPYIWLTRSQWQRNQKSWLKKITTSLKYPLFVKPSRGGSSIGTTKVSDKDELVRALDLAVALDTRVVVEEGITDAREINISVMGNAGHPLEYSVCEEVFHAGSDFLNFEKKYLSSDGKSQGMASASRVVPADLDAGLVNKIQEYSAMVFNTLDLAGLVRIDYLIKGKTVYCVEVNTIPGSLSFFLWDKSGYPFPKLIERLVDLSQVRFAESKSTLTDFSSSLLTSFASSTNSKLGSKLS